MYMYAAILRIAIDAGVIWNCPGGAASVGVGSGAAASTSFPLQGSHMLLLMLLLCSPQASAEKLILMQLPGAPILFLFAMGDSPFVMHMGFGLQAATFTGRVCVATRISHMVTSAVQTRHVIASSIGASRDLRSGMSRKPVHTICLTWI